MTARVHRSPTWPPWPPNSKLFWQWDGSFLTLSSPHPALAPVPSLNAQIRTPWATIPPASACVSLGAPDGSPASSGPGIFPQEGPPLHTTSSGNPLSLSIEWTSVVTWMVTRPLSLWGYLRYQHPASLGGTWQSDAAGAKSGMTTQFIFSTSLACSSSKLLPTLPLSTNTVFF